MHLVTGMSHASSGLRASPSGWMNERVVGLAGGRGGGGASCSITKRREKNWTVSVGGGGG